MNSSDSNNYEKFSAPPQPSAPYNQGQPIPTGTPVQLIAPAPWSTGLFDCSSDVPHCCLTCWCPCITFGQIAEIVDKGSSSCGTSGALYALIQYLSGCGCLYSCTYRSKLRQQYMLPQTPCGDWVVHCFCELCALCQEHRELQNRGFDMSIGWQGNMERNNGGVTMVPVAPGGMSR